MKKKKESVATIVFRESDSHVLLIKRRDIPVWVLPGGGIEEGETPEEAAIRETEEETGLSIKIKRKVALYKKNGCFTKHTHFYECVTVKGAISTGNETKDIAFFPVVSLPKKLVPTFKTWIEDALNHHPSVLVKPIKKASYLTFIQYLCIHPVLVFRFLLTRLGIHINS